MNITLGPQILAPTETESKNLRDDGWVDRDMVWAPRMFGSYSRLTASGGDFGFEIPAEMPAKERIANHPHPARVQFADSDCDLGIAVFGG